MQHSLTYYLTIAIVKLKGLKKKFSEDPIDYKAIRKDDVQMPKGRFFNNLKINNFEISKSKITEIKQKNDSKKLLIFIHGGAFVSGPGQHHWDTSKEISLQTNQTVWMCNYPKAPEHTISEISANIDGVYTEALKTYKPKQITLIGDSVGGTLITALVQRLILKKIETPKQIILVCPVMDASLSNSEIEEIDKTDPILGKRGVLSAKKLCAENDNLSDSKISPLNGSFERFPHTMLFVATNDITYPDQKITVKKMEKAEVELQVIEGKGMPHVWPFLPVMKEAKIALKQIINRLNNH